jgi:hypothetical protein
VRTGFPFSVVQETDIISGGVYSYRYPLNFDLNLAIERTVTSHGYRFALIGSPQYLQFLGDEGRHFVVRIRFFCRASARSK